MFNTNKQPRPFMRLKVILLILVFSLSTMPIPSSEAQIGAAAVNLDCTSGDPSGTVEVEVHPGATLTGQAFCTVSNPNSYQEKIEIEVTSDGLVASYPGSITLGPNSEEDFIVTVKADERMSAQSRNLVVKATVTEMMGFPPPNLAEEESSLIVSIMQFSGLQVEAVEPMVKMLPKIDFNLEFKLYNQGNNVDKFWLEVTDNSRDQLESEGFSISLPINKIEVESMAAPVKVRVTMRTPVDYQDWPINSEGMHEKVFRLEFMATSEFSCNNEGSCNSESVISTITVYQEASSTDNLISSASDNSLIIYGGSGAGIILLLVLIMAMRKSKK